VLHNVAHRQLHRLILTLANDNHNLSQRLDRLYQSLSRLRRHDYWQRNVVGGLYRLHVDFTDHWHPHFDMIIETAPIDATTMKSCWLLATGDSNVLKIQRVHNSETDKLKLTRYILKPTFRSIAHDDALMEEYTRAVRKRRTVQRFGIWLNNRTRKEWKRLPRPQKLAPQQMAQSG
jgi:hypothetical protein